MISSLSKRLQGGCEHITWVIVERREIATTGEELDYTLSWDDVVWHVQTTETAFGKIDGG
jgi:hypothetical protein